MFTSLTDPNKLVDDSEFKKLSLKIDKALLKMAGKTEKGGNPFLFALCGTKPHYLANEIPGFHQAEFTSAATDGKVFFWNPEFLGRVPTKDLITVMNHETWHVVLRHVERSIGKEPKVWNIAIDYVVNSILERDHKLLRRPGSAWSISAFGPSISLGNFLKFLEGKIQLPPAADGKSGIFSDPNIYHKNVNEIYDEIIKRWEDNEADKPKEILDDRFDGDEAMDAHLPTESDDDDELQEELIRASKTAEIMEPGSTPEFIKTKLQKLSNPKFDFLDIIKMAIFNRVNNNGVKNNWKRPRRRWLALGHYLPSKFSFKPKWLCLLDTSGSMTDEDISFGISQLKSLGDDTDGFVVPCDVKVHWDAVQKIENSSDLKSTNVKGGGGTSMNSFFNEYQEKLGSEFDVIIVITDGFLLSPPAILAPPCQVVWGITRKSTDFIPKFGQVSILNR